MLPRMYTSGMRQKRSPSCVHDGVQQQQQRRFVQRRQQAELLLRFTRQQPQMQAVMVTAAYNTSQSRR